MVFLHHSLVSYQEWDEFINMIGGRYYLQDYFKDTLKVSGFEHDLDMCVKVLDSDHSVTKDIRDFQIHDEGYLTSK
jgi:hypothetical protein